MSCRLCKAIAFFLMPPYLRVFAEMQGRDVSELPPEGSTNLI